MKTFPVYLYRPSHRPYDPKEIELIRKFNAYADEDAAGGTVPSSCRR